MKVLRYKDAMAIIVIIIILISSIEKVSDFFRRKILNENKI